MKTLIVSLPARLAYLAFPGCMNGRGPVTPAEGSLLMQRAGASAAGDKPQRYSSSAKRQDHNVILGACHENAAPELVERTARFWLVG
ncbi:MULTISPECIES: hypothetical protein [Alphaproteobacteria]|uniref:hypothetical protein n=2 Tax=Pseudomonadota TaxID=1224 RepID=UPI002357CD42|nr:hypothetical protein [Fulvimarina manganoxydans]MCK5934934.1 hypothetical protein [Fulvimarina manganoxydans]